MHRILKSLPALALVGMPLGLMPAATQADSNNTMYYEGQLNELNGSGTSGMAYVAVTGDQATVMIKTTGASANLPHAEHIHIGGEGVCPTAAADTNHDGVVSVAEAAPNYGAIGVSLTSTGDVSAASALAVDRFPVADSNGSFTYERTFTLPAGVTADDLMNSEIVQHGISKLYDDPTKYDGSKPSSIDPSLPLEATVPADCGHLNRMYVDSAGSPYTVLSNYSTHPGDMVTATSHGYAPGQPVNFSLGNQHTTVMANDQGVASTNLTVPWQGAGNATVKASSDVASNYSEASFYVGGYYPNANPASYYLPMNQSTSVSGTGFAPNEMVDLSVSGGTSMEMMADGSGNVTFNYMTPSSGDNYTVTLKGETSNTTSSRTVTLAQQY